ncbi:pentapeptide repeat-containing protein [Chryseobacterium profundimaris]|uniref:Pentapeptide repeat-containing protein n=1 Tax=Chryseobacterium profundimaris TaxID=1387275 RepID=A0ABY1NDA2_9FLAO|nr:pentapeptide repeat-containing protein [Chryseobacterium profundimaris]SMP06167.1 Pentapeptide repeat-containing protein [Chryseobacterium profundimaris]
MKEAYFLDETFESAGFSQIQKGEYENCIFRNCNLEYADLSGFSFIDCKFVGCNLSLTKLVSTAFRNVVFKESKMFGLHFDDCNEFGMSFSFDGCALNNSVFYKATIRKTIFKNSKLIEVDFTESDLSSSVFNNCDLSGAVFDNTNLEKADFRTSVHYAIDPLKNRLKKAKFSLSEIPGLLHQFDIEIDKNG